jgi:hypothetical protein
LSSTQSFGTLSGTVFITHIKVKWSFGGRRQKYVEDQHGKLVWGWEEEHGTVGPELSGYVIGVVHYDALRGNNLEDTVPQAHVAGRDQRPWTKGRNHSRYQRHGQRGSSPHAYQPIWSFSEHLKELVLRAFPGALSKGSLNQN